MARPRKVIDPKLVQSLARIQCSADEIAAVVEDTTGQTCSRETIVRRFRDVIEKGHQVGKMRVRRAQFKLLESGNATMAVWLGKVVLGQREVEFDTSDVRVVVQWDDGKPHAYDPATSTASGAS